MGTLGARVAGTLDIRLLRDRNQRLLGEAAPVDEIEAILGDRVLAITQRYAHFQSQRLIEAALITSITWLSAPSI